MMFTKNFVNYDYHNYSVYLVIKPCLQRFVGIFNAHLFKASIRSWCERPKQSHQLQKLVQSDMAVTGFYSRKKQKIINPLP